MSLFFLLLTASNTRGTPLDVLRDSLNYFFCLFSFFFFLSDLQVGSFHLVYLRSSLILLSLQAPVKSS